MSAPFDLAVLIDAVEARGPADPLAAIREASTVAAELAELSDRLIGYYVERARSEGRSWAEIGTLVGISRQAAQQRFAARLASLGLDDLERAGAMRRMTGRAHETLRRAEAHSRRLHHPALGPSHVLLALLEDADSLATKALAEAGITTADLRRLLNAELRPGRGASPEVLPLDATTRQVMANAVTEALRLGHNYVGTEHLLLGLMKSSESWLAQRCAEQGVGLAAVRQAVVAVLTEYLKARN